MLRVGCEAAGEKETDAAADTPCTAYPEYNIVREARTKIKYKPQDV